MSIQFIQTDGGRSAAGFKGSAGDCVARAVTLVSGRPYAEIYKALAVGTGDQRASKKSKKRGATASRGIDTQRLWFKAYMQALGFRWVPTMAIGSGCKVHLHEAELPPGRLVVAVSRHYAAVIDRVLFDTHDCSRNGKRCVYGYWIADTDQPTQVTQEQTR